MVNLITEHIDIWSAAQTQKNNNGRGRGKNSNGLSPHGIKKLRKLILDLAVRGKLVPQNPNDIPANVLLEKIAKEKARLIKKGEIKKQKKLPEISKDEKPFELPAAWEWTRLGDVTNYGISEKAEPDDVDEDTWILELGDVEKETSKLLKKVRFADREFRSSKNHFSEGDVIYGKLRPYLDKVIVADENGVCTTEMIPLRSYAEIIPQYVRLVMKSPYFIQYAIESTHGMNLPRMGTEKARLSLFPIVSEAEQHRIVAKVDELMALCDQLEQQQTDSNATHQTLVETLLTTLTNAADQKELTEAWQRIANHFDTLFTTEQSIDQLKQTVLQLAVMGKLVQQDPNDEPASVLLEKIAKKKARLIKEGKIKKQTPLPGISEDEKPFELPEGWEWTRLDYLSSDINYGYTASANQQKKDVRLLRITDIQDDSVNWELVPGCDINEKKIANYQLEDGDILIARTGGTIGKSYLVSGINLCSVFASYLIRVRRIKGMYSSFIKTYLGSQLYWNQLYANSMGTGQPNVNGSALKNLVFALPPLFEQHRILAKVDELMALCDALNARLNDAQTTQVKLADTIVEQAVT
jgi:type I restriction enzyme, S subunit